MHALAASSTLAGAPLARSGRCANGRGVRLGSRRAILARATSEGASEESSSSVLMLRTAEELDALLERCKAEKRKCVVNVSSSKCGPCKLLLPTLEAYGEKYPDCSFARFYFDLDDSLQARMKEWGVQGVPTYRMYEPNGELKSQFTTGVPTKLGSTLYLFLS